ncbi:MAG: 16S rRNA (guanine(527)-N(7))-methyltransferase RsmG [Elusimicrobia bacterium RIFOXYA2_FULL_58_8]|nr:MAG: 16S rRNA (guanine(527)-N(7))-methyltransferase RsmG [Elusimicrobia bacterium RIFOXYA2_FULL_58_8]OGS14320.1 MAG: 16S rRNA (guanine(527)-N(7))-methyltransferase RsmG [Elusimicrobia bacterium RIFOXYA12_FULL_57_11]
MNDELNRIPAGWGIDLSGPQLKKILVFAGELKAGNSLMNLISQKDEPQLWQRHILDSLAAAPLLRRLLKPGALIADSGTGAGFPGMPLAAALEEFVFELLDSNGKRCAFLGRAAAAMQISNASVFQRRVGEGPRRPRYDAVIERAMGQLENILPQCLNMLMEGGVFLAWQSAAQLAAPRQKLVQVMRKAHAEILEKLSYRLPGEQEDRFIVVFRKQPR